MSGNGRRRAQRTALAILACHLAVTGTALAGGGSRQHAVSLIAAPSHGPQFPYFNWVNPDAPKGGTVRLWSLGSYDTLNPFATRGLPAEGLVDNGRSSPGLVFESLLTSCADQPATHYALIADWLAVAPDHSAVTFGLREGARFHDGEPIKPADVVFTFDVLKGGHPRYGLVLKNVAKAQVTGPREVTFHFDVTGNRELVPLVGALPVLPRHFWTAKGASGETRNLLRALHEPPLGSGPYRIKEHVPGRAVIYERVKDWWGRDLPVNRGQWNFDEIRYSYFQDRLPAFEQFKAGRLDFWAERSAKGWATGYEFDAVRHGHVVKHAIPIGTITGMQGFALNTRRKALQDVRVRRALNLAFDFEWANANVAYGQYLRVGSFFGNSDLEATGLPIGREREIILELGSELPPEMLKSAYRNPVNGSPDEVRRNMTEASRLLGEAGWTLQEAGSGRSGRERRNSAGEALTLEFLIVQRDFERLVQPYIKALELLGIKATMRLVDAPQYVRRIESFDFDIIVRSFPQSLWPGNELRELWGSASADREGSGNIMGIRSPGIDKLVDKVIFAPNRAELVAAARALDRALLWGAYLVPMWYAPNERLAMWSMFAHPAKLPSQSASFLRVWWRDETAEKKLFEARAR